MTTSGARDVPAPFPWGRVAVLLLLCAFPHFVRLAGPLATARDGFYAHGAWMIANGHEPYVDFTQVAFPFLEHWASWWIAAFGPHLRVVELATLVVVLATALALFTCGRRLANGWAGALMALGWSWSVWVLAFNLLERETYAALGTALALAAYARPGALTGRRALVVAGALLLGTTMKITAVMPALALCAHLALRGDARGTLRLGLTYAAGVLLVTGGCWLAYGWPFLWQTYLFGFFRNQTHDAAAAWAFLVRHLDPVLLVGLVAALAYGVPRLRRREGAVVLVLAADLLYLTAVSPTIWDHNLIALVVPCSVLFGLWIDGFGARWRSADAASRWERAVTPACLAVLVVLGVREPSWRAMSGLRAVRLGMGGRPRAEIEERGAFLARHSEPGQLVVTLEPWEAFVADRPKLVRYWDLMPVALGVEASLRADGLAATFAKRRGVLVLGPGRPPPPPGAEALKDPYVARLAANAVHWIRPRLLAALATKRVAVVLEDLPPAVLTETDLIAAGYQRVEEGRVAGWVPVGGVVDGGVEPIYGR